MWLIYLEGGQWCGAPRVAYGGAAADASRIRRCARCYNNVTCYVRAQGAATLASSKAWDKATRVRDARSVAHAATRG